MGKKFTWLSLIVFFSLMSCQAMETTEQTMVTSSFVSTSTPSLETETPKFTETPPPTPTQAYTGPDILELPGQTIADGEQFTPLQLDEYISDLDHQPDEMAWELLAEGELNVQIKRGVLIVSPPVANWVGSESIQLEACDPDGQCATAQTNYTVEFVNDAPVVTDIDDQLIFLDEEFHSILLDNYVDDADNADDEITWHADDNTELTIHIDQRIVTILPPDAEWRGPETVQLTACDPGGLCDHAEAVFMVQEPDDLKITFVANAGFLIEAGENKVAIDALLQPWAGYQSLTAADVSKMENARWPFDEIDLIFVTHDHFDHYAVDVLKAHLEQNPDTIGLSSQGVDENLRVIADDENLLDRMIGKRVRSGEKAQMIINEIGVELMHFPHGPGSPENLGVIFSIGGFRVLHTGDLNPDQTLDALRNYQLSEKEIDVAMVPAFWLTISRYQEFLEEINARYFIPMHFDPVASSMLEEMQAEFPQAIFFEKIYDTWTLQH